MTALRALCALIFLVLLGYTGVVIARHGMDIAPVFFGDIAKLAWPGQFDLDFLFMLLLVSLWVAHRHRFSPRGIALGFGAAIGGMLFLSAYLLIASLRARGDLAVLLLGEDHQR